MRSSARTKDLKNPPGVSILRPIKSPSESKIEPHLIECLLSTIRQNYPLFELVLTVAEASDPAIPDIKQIIHENPKVDITLIIGEENIGINPKINNLVRGWRKLKYDIVWIVDCNVWLDPGALVRAVDVLTGQPYVHGEQEAQRRPAKLVHHLPLCIDTGEVKNSRGLPAAGWTSTFGARLEEEFLSSSHCKFYCAINTVAVAPCVLGKSNMFRKSHLMELCPPTATSEGGLSYFSDKMCEDHLIGEKLWQMQVKDE